MFNIFCYTLIYIFKNKSYEKLKNNYLMHSKKDPIPLNNHFGSTPQKYEPPQFLGFGSNANTIPEDNHCFSKLPLLISRNDQLIGFWTNLIFVLLSLF